ncbi:proton-conducting membrane transporter [Methylonatrum kenyense]|uniref:complex I subunit 5 family protein n=1 Tax=Methylonatrum kenyense TaxID=455253 RepID=UPI0020BE0AB8|nr:proton-conducting transporter membrane subunit [Methylonatrum kenyense]MCK8517066.1 proton-conducting membrane transporter [Methylonatrum kenyense]
MTEALPVLLVFVPFLAGLGQFVLGRAVPWSQQFVSGFNLLLVLLLLRAVAGGEPVIADLGGWGEPLAIHLQADGLATLMLLLTAVLAVAISLYAIPAFGGHARSAWQFWTLWPLLLGSLNALFLSRDLFNIYVTLELVTLAAIPLVLLAGPRKTVDAALRYLLFALLGSLIYLAGVALLYAQAGTLDLALLPAATPTGSLAGPLAAALIITGILIKGAILPFHIWLPAAHGGAPAAVSAILSALVVKAAIYLLLRLWTGALEPLVSIAAGQLLGLLGASAVLFGSWQAFRQSRLKLVVAYSTVAQLGYMLLFFPMAVTAAWQGAVYHGLAHGVAKAALFLAAGNLLYYLGQDRLEALRGIDRPLAVSLLAFGLAGVSIMGLPPSGGFTAKWLLLTASLQTGQWWWTAALVAGGLLAAGYIFRVLRLAFLQSAEPAERRDGPVPGRLMAWTATALALLAIGLGLISAPLLDLLGDIPGGGS